MEKDNWCFLKIQIEIIMREAHPELSALVPGSAVPCRQCPAGGAAGPVPPGPAVRPRASEPSPGAPLLPAEIQGKVDS